MDQQQQICGMSLLTTLTHACEHLRTDCCRTAAQQQHTNTQHMQSFTATVYPEGALPPRFTGTRGWGRVITSIRRQSAESYSQQHWTVRRTHTRHTNRTRAQTQWETLPHVGTTLRQAPSHSAQSQHNHVARRPQYQHRHTADKKDKMSRRAWHTTTRGGGSPSRPTSLRAAACLHTQPPTAVTAGRHLANHTKLQPTDSTTLPLGQAPTVCPRGRAAMCHASYVSRVRQNCGAAAPHHARHQMRPRALPVARALRDTSCPAVRTGRGGPASGGACTDRANLSLQRLSQHQQQHGRVGPNTG